MLIIDRFENGFAVCQSEGGNVNIPRELIDPEAREGDAIGESDGKYTVLKQQTELRRKRIRGLLKGLFKE